MNSKNICVLSVTYGDRVEYVVKMLTELLKDSRIKKIILVDNASSLTNNLLPTDINNIIKVVKNSENLGSAGGYKIAVQEYLKNPVEDFILFIDDDNVITSDTIDILISKYVQSENKNIALLCNRKEMKKYWLISTGVLKKESLISHSSFARFSFVDLINKIKFRIKSKKAENKAFLKEPICIEEGYWSGLFVPRSLIVKNGLPDASFYLYREDYEYIKRFIKNGFQLYLIPNAKLIELDYNWASTKSRHIFSFAEITGDAFRTYYSVRNAVYCEEYILNDKTILRKINKYSYILLILLFSFFQNRKRFNLIMTAIKDGSNKNMGKKIGLTNE